MKLYFNHKTNTFSTTPKESYVEVFEPFECKRHEKEPVEISLGIFKVIICRDNWHFTNEGPVQWLWIDIYVQGVLLLPISNSCRKTAVHYHFSESQIAFLQYGHGHNKGKSPHTYMQARDHIDWDEALNSIVYICNNYEDWIVHETKELQTSLIAHEKNNFLDIATLIDLARRYECIAPSIIPVYREFVDKYCFQAMNELLKYVENNQLDDINKNRKTICGDTIWNYIKDYHLSV